MSNQFWQVIESQIAELMSAASADDVLRILRTDGNPYGDPTISNAPAFFAGGGGDLSVGDALFHAGWRTVYAEASYYWVMEAPNGDLISYVEGDVYRGDRIRKETVQ